MPIEASSPANYRATPPQSVDIIFEHDDNARLQVTVDTERLCLRSVDASDENTRNYQSLFGNPVVMAKYGHGQPVPPEPITKRVNQWSQRWDKQDPFSSLAVFKNDTDAFIGHIVLGHGDLAGHSELAYMFGPQHWGQGLGFEAVDAVVNIYAPETVAQGYMCSGSLLETIDATARQDNPASVKILEKVGMVQTKEEIKFGAPRMHFTKHIDSPSAGSYPTLSASL